VNRRHDRLEQLPGARCHDHTTTGQLSDLLCRHLAALSELRTSAATTANPLPWAPARAGLDRSIEGQQIGLIRNVVDDANLLGDPLHGRDGLLHGLATFHRLLKRLWSPYCR